MSRAPTTPPGPPNRLGLGNLRGMIADQLSYMTEAAEYGPIVNLPILFERYYLVREPALVQQALTQGHSVMRKDRYTRELSRVMGQGLVTSDGDLWRRQRKLVAQAFIPRRIQSYAGAMVDATERSLALWSDGEALNINRAMGELTLDVVGRTLFDADVRGEAKEVGDALHVISEFYADLLEKPIVPPNWWPSPLMRRFRRHAHNVDVIVRKIIEERRQSGGDRGDLLSALLAAQDDEGGMSDQQLRDECITLFLAGHETTSLALANTLYLLSRHPDVEQALYEEVTSTLGTARATADDVRRLPHTERVIKESLRLYPPVYATGREVLEPYELGGYRVDPGVTLLFVPWVTHRHRDYFDDPLRFDPDRWLPERAGSLHRYAYFPFGGGPRVCIGNHFAMTEAILLLATLTRAYRFELHDGQELTLRPSVTLRPAHDLQMTLRARGRDPAKAA
ncbi:MAG: cytochrome P450 [Polyangiales bacterium]